jgi:hypothetical protein
MGRSLLNQLEQIYGSINYDDGIVGVNNASVAEPTISGSLEGDLNTLRTIVKDLKGSTDWYSDTGTYFDPTDTDALNSENKVLSLDNIRNKTLDSKTLLIPVTNDNSGAGYSVTSTSTGTLLSVTTRYATDTNRVGLPIFSSTSNTGSYHDESGADSTCVVDVIDTNTGNQFRDNAGHVVYAKLHDGADFAGSGDGTDVFARFYSNGSVTDLTTVSGVTPSSVGYVYPHRYTMDSLPEGWLRRDFVSGVEGDVEIIEDIYNILQYIGSSDGVIDPTWSNVAASYLLETNPTDLVTAVDLINSGVGSRLYTEDNYVIDGQDITASINSLDIALKDVEDSVTSSSGAKYIEEVSSHISKNTLHTVPAVYTPDSTVDQEGSNMDVYVNGQMLSADSGTNGANADRDYGESTTTQITFRFNIRKGANIVYVIRQ